MFESKEFLLHTSCLIQDALGLDVSAMFTGSKRGSEVNTRFGSQAAGLRVEEIHFQYKLETSNVLGAHLANVP